MPMTIRARRLINNIIMLLSFLLLPHSNSVFSNKIFPLCQWGSAPALWNETVDLLPFDLWNISIWSDIKILFTLKMQSAIINSIWISCSDRPRDIHLPDSPKGLFVHRFGSPRIITFYSIFTGLLVRCSHERHYLQFEHSNERLRRNNFVHKRMKYTHFFLT